MIEESVGENFLKLYKKTHAQDTNAGCGKQTKVTGE